VPEKLHEAVVEALVARAARVRVGDGTMPGIHLGPINNRPQLSRITSLVDEAIDQGATAAIGGRSTQSEGYFYPLTILTNARDEMRVVREEQFGPALPVLRYTKVDEAIERANATEYGLSGSVWSADAERAAKVAARLECGTRYVNTHLAIEPHIPFGGVKLSGVGVENGAWGLREFMDLHVDYAVRPRA
jgi:acyl-CoA reductase-like NAD-dependent aldehyde dehydrogenase